MTTRKQNRCVCCGRFLSNEDSDRRENACPECKSDYQQEEYMAEEDEARIREEIDGIDPVAAWLGDAWLEDEESIDV